MPSIYQLKPAFQNLLRPMVQRLYDKGVTANQVTVLAGAVSVLVGAIVAGFASTPGCSYWCQPGCSCAWP